MTTAKLAEIIVQTLGSIEVDRIYGVPAILSFKPTGHLRTE
jgi:hypothetical protein